MLDFPQSLNKVKSCGCLATAETICIWTVKNIKHTVWEKSCLAELKEHGHRGETTSPEGQAKCVGHVCMYVFVHGRECSRMRAFEHVPQRLYSSCGVCVPCVQPAGTVLGLFFSGPADNWGKAGRMGLPHRPWRFWRSFYILHNQDYLLKHVKLLSQAGT